MTEYVDDIVADDGPRAEMLQESGKGIRTLPDGNQVPCVCF
jgi:hypothetical protein